MERRAFIAGTLALLAAPLTAEAQQAGKVARIVFLRSGPPPKAFVEAFEQGLRELGYVVGKDIVIEYRFADGRTVQLMDLAREVVRSKPDAILASGATAAFAARDSTATIPIIFAGTVDPVENGLAASLAQPGGNVTGMGVLSVDLLAKRLQLLGELIPSLSRVALLWTPTNPTHTVQLKKLQGVAETLGLHLLELAVRTAEDFDPALMTAQGTQALLQMDDPLFTTHRELLARLALKRRLPAMYGIREMVDAGGLMSYGAILPDLYRRAAAYVEKVLKGTRPRDLPIQQPTKFEMVINLKTAKALGLTIPPSVLARADEVIQ
jgi:putative ABC transport system substrate-binding protein